MKESFAESLGGSPSRMFDEAALAPVRQLNAHALDLLSECSRHPAWSGSAWENALGRRFSRMSAELRAGLAQSPISLLEFGCSICYPRPSMRKQTRPPSSSPWIKRWNSRRPCSPSRGRCPARTLPPLQLCSGWGSSRGSMGLMCATCRVFPSGSPGASGHVGSTGPVSGRSCYGVRMVRDPPTPPPRFCESCNASSLMSDLQQVFRG